MENNVPLDGVSIYQDRGRDFIAIMRDDVRGLPLEKFQLVEIQERR